MSGMRVDPRLQPPPPPASLTRDPWRVFFPLGVLLGWTGVLHWLLYGLGVGDAYRATFHATAQIQGFLTCIAIGFLYTFIPRRTGTPPPSALEMAAGAAAPVVATLAYRWTGPRDPLPSTSPRSSPESASSWTGRTWR